MNQECAVHPKIQYRQMVSTEDPFQYGQKSHSTVSEYCLFTSSPDVQKQISYGVGKVKIKYCSLQKQTQYRPTAIGTLINRSVVVTNAHIFDFLNDESSPIQSSSLQISFQIRTCQGVQRQFFVNTFTISPYYELEPKLYFDLAVLILDDWSIIQPEQVLALQMKQIGNVNFKFISDASNKDFNNNYSVQIFNTDHLRQFCNPQKSFYFLPLEEFRQQGNTYRYSVQGQLNIVNFGQPLILKSTDQPQKIRIIGIHVGQIDKNVNMCVSFNMIQNKCFLLERLYEEQLRLKQMSKIIQQQQIDLLKQSARNSFSHRSYCKVSKRSCLECKKTQQSFDKLMEQQIINFLDQKQQALQKLRVKHKSKLNALKYFQSDQKREHNRQKQIYEQIIKKLKAQYQLLLQQNNILKVIIQEKKQQQQVQQDKRQSLNSTIIIELSDVICKLQDQIKTKQKENQKLKSDINWQLKWIQNLQQKNYMFIDDISRCNDKIFTYEKRILKLVEQIDKLNGERVNIVSGDVADGKPLQQINGNDQMIKLSQANRGLIMSLTSEQITSSSKIQISNNHGTQQKQNNIPINQKIDTYQYKNQELNEEEDNLLDQKQNIEFNVTQSLIQQQVNQENQIKRYKASQQWRRQVGNVTQKAFQRYKIMIPKQVMHLKQNKISNKQKYQVYQKPLKKKLF